MSHANARLTPAGRLIMVQRIGSGRAVAHVAAERGISRTTAWRWWRRFREHGTAGLVDRSSVAHGHPRRTGACVEARVRIMRHLTRRGPVFIVHTVIDDHSRVAYAEIHDDEKGVTAAGVLERAITFYARLGVRVERVISDNAFAYRHSAAFKAVIDTHAIKQRFIKPHCPWTNGKVERLNRTLATEWAYARPWTSNDDRRAGLTTWLDHYNLDRAHLGIGGKTPIDRINNGRGQYTSAPRTRRSPRSRSARAWCRTPRTACRRSCRRCWRRPRPSVSRSCRC